MRFLPLLLGLASAVLSIQNTSLSQEIVTWDDKSLFIYGERILLLSGEFHPFRLPSPGLWLDVFQKVRALGYSAVSFYVDWALLEGQPGHIRTQGVFDLEQFFDAAQEAGLYLIARPGPYINAEVSGGGFPGWLQRLDGPLKRTNSSYLAAITPYIAAVGEIVARAQITNGGPVILVQPENEYTICMTETGYTQMNNESVTAANNMCLEKEYMAYVERQYRQAGVVVPLIVNDAEPLGDWAPGTGVGAVDIYSFDFYPLQWSTAPPNASNWSSLNNPLEWYNYTVHEAQSPTTPVSISEFQGGVPDAWYRGGVGVDTGAAYIGPEFERMFYKLNYSYRAALQSLYMIFGGTNWGNLGHPGGYTSYDVGAAIKEDRQVTREKYSELKLQAGFLQSSPAYLISQPDNGTYGVYTDSTALATARLHTNTTNFYIVRHGELADDDTVSYKLQVSTSIGNISIPQLGGSLSLHGRDSKIHVVDYDVGGINLIYSTAEVFSWKKAGNKSVLVLYGGEGETHEFAVPGALTPSAVEGDGLLINSSASTVIQWSVQPSRRVVHFGEQLEVHLLWRNEAYNYWVLDLPLPGISRHASPSRANSSIIAKAGYLLRTASVSGTTLQLTGDLNATTELEIIAAPPSISTVLFNSQLITTTKTNGRLHATLPYQPPPFALPFLSSLQWHYTDSLPEIHPTYDDDLWTVCNHTSSHNPRSLTTPTSLYSSDYGYNGASLVYRGTFTANGSESALYLLTEGGYAYGHSIWLNNTFLSSWQGSPAEMFHNQTLLFPSLQPGGIYTLTILIDHMGNDENFPANGAIMKDPRGVLDYTLYGREKDVISWKMRGNLGGENYKDHSRGPLNEGAWYAERQGYHLPGAPVEQWESSHSPTEKVISAPGIRFYATEFDLSLPEGYDIPLSVVFTNTTVLNSTDESPAQFRTEIFVNGWQFGKYINHIGPQTRFPIPEGILNYNGSNYLALTIWSMDTRPFQLAGVQLQADAVIQIVYAEPHAAR
ncbi:glycoside hydrolase family 35 protein [Aspergillus ibericus CBS 121593]|uniref:Beta-galactosidase n=1 Tax=Aspergillus ibericus CBS 121593 TaxID=1448316 RepID=A0A395H7H4_9EURO|nr:beta-galactosidase [Aspergillus ibericus CBS 121593]RAL03867.1 beta-galactosidase [Aspergillus ibericus CBS 121593]